MDKNTTNHVAVDDGLLKMQEKIGNLGISTLKVTIKQAPDATNGHVAIAQTELQVGSIHVSMPGFATPDTANAVGTFIVVVGIKKGLKPFLDFVGQYVFFNFEAKAGFIVSFDDPFNRAVNWLVKNGLESHHASLVYTSQ